MTLQIFTIGHSDRTFESFADLLDDAEVAAIADVRRLPGSRRHPQFNEETLRQALTQIGLTYRRETALGGRRTVSPAVPDEVNGMWRNRGFHNFADYALSEEFGHGLAQLREWAGETQVAVMCSEAVWWRCHRRIIADHLLAHGDDVVHIMARGRMAAARLTPGAVVGDDDTVTYPAGSTSSWTPALRAQPGDRPRSRPVMSFANR